MRAEAITLILLYTDAPPHMDWEDNGYSHAEKEAKALKDAKKSGEHGRLFVDWALAAHTLKAGEKKAHVMSILEEDFADRATGYYEFLSTVTGGATISVDGDKPENISQVTVEILLEWMGVHKAGTQYTSFPAKLRYHSDTKDIMSVQSEEDQLAKRYFDTNVRAGFLRGSFTTLNLSTVVLGAQLPKKANPLQDFAKSYKDSSTYRALVVRQLREIIERDVSTISLNPVFGSLWRTFCNDRESDHRQELLDLFGRRIEGLRDGSEKARMKAWLEESYDYTAEVQEAISKVPESIRFPCVCLDPSLTFVRPDAEDDNEDVGNRSITSFRRDELLEIGRSCDWRILRRLGRVLTRLTFVESVEAMPAHIALASETEYPRIPMALASWEYGRRFWRMLLHIVVPGTMLSARPAALLAALTIRLGVQPLVPAAEQEMMFWRTKWNDIEIPETWNVNCLSLLLDADKTCWNKQNADANIGESEGLLLDSDRVLFERLVDYKMLELNLGTTLTARVGWTPNKTTMPIGPLVVCKSCDYPRSVTIMGPGGVCGMCLCDFENPAEKQKATSTRVARSDDETTNAIWVECSVQTCRAQYVIYCVDMLNVRPKCHFCRQHGNESAKAVDKIEAPVVECTKCLSRMIWPVEYRPNEYMSGWSCIACNAGIKTEVGTETTAAKLKDENGSDWILRNDDMKLKSPFNGRTLYHTVSNAQPLDNFTTRVGILPAKRQDTIQLFHRGKLIRNAPNLLDELYSWVSRRRTESGTCSLCFSNFRKTDLLLACGRSGCPQRICKACLEGWYGLNAAGRIINTAALSCPFCRRAPTAKTLARYGMGIHAVGHLRDAVEQSGTWIYAWCAGSRYAKLYIERVCAAGAPPDLQGWTCDDCRTAKSHVRTKDCPSCRTPTQKVGGCDHIQCTVTGCGAHWCFFCGKQCDVRMIYDHMNTEHGGYYGGGDEESDEDEDDEI